MVELRAQESMRLVGVSSMQEGIRQEENHHGEFYASQAKQAMNALGNHGMIGYAAFAAKAVER